MNGDVAILFTTSKQGLSFWQLNTFDWQIQDFPTKNAEQQWLLFCNNWKQSHLNKAIQKSASGQEISSRLACVTLQHELYVVDIAQHHIIWPIRKVQAYDITSICFLHHDELLCIGTKDGQLKIFQLVDGKHLKTLMLGSSPISRMTASKDDFLAVQLDECRIEIVSLEDDGTIKNGTLEPFDFGITNMSFSPFYHSLLAIAGDDGSVTVVDTKSTERFVKIQFSSAHLSPVSLIAFSPTNSCLLCSVGLDKRLCFFDMEKKKKRIRMFSLNDFCESLQFLNSGSHLIISFRQGRLSLFDLRGGIQERSSIATSQVIESITILDKTVFEKTTLRNERDNNRILPPTLYKSEAVDEEKENIHSVSNRMDSKKQDSFQSSHTTEEDSCLTDELLLDNSLLRNGSTQLVVPPKESNSLDCLSNHLSESMIVIRSKDNSMQRREHLSERKQLQEEVDGDYLPTKGDSSRPFSTSWDETPILAISSSKQQVHVNSEKNGSIFDETVTQNPKSISSYPNPFQCLLQDSASPSYDSRSEQLENENKDLASHNIYSGLLQSIEDIQYASNREIKQHIQNLHIDVIRNFEEQHSRIQELEQGMLKLMKHIQLLEQKAQQDRILFP
ncbi:Beta-galactosidase 3 [Galdieria sulphuraria]|nr:Beta-galactosidase 3 [Galdieria sulphuraria]